MFVEDTTHYKLQGRDADAEWDLLVPGDGLIYLTPDLQPFSITMFHELRCLNIIRLDLTRVHTSNLTASAPSALSRHCLNYIRQMVFCYADTRLDQLAGSEINAHPDVYICRDWASVYRQVKDNQDSYRNS